MPRAAGAGRARRPKPHRARSAVRPTAPPRAGPGRDRRGGRQMVDRQHDTAQQEQGEEQAVGDGQGGLRPEGAGKEQAEPGEGQGPGRTPRADQGRARARCPAETQRRDARSRTAWPISTRTTVTIFAVTSPARGSGDPPSRLSTPYARSNAVEMPRLTRLVETIARARIARDQERHSALVDGRDEREEGEQDERDDDRHEQVLAAPAEEPELHADLGHGRAADRSGIPSDRRTERRSAGSVTLDPPPAPAGQLEIAFLERRSGRSAGRR